jgi:hypothetical protein
MKLKLPRLIPTALAVVVAAVAAFFLSATFAPAQIGPQGFFYTISGAVKDLGSIKTLTAQGAATVTSTDQSGIGISRVVCVLNQSTHTGTPSTTFKIQNKDVASGNYYDLITSAATTNDSTPNGIAAGSGVATTTNVGAGFPLGRYWRVSLTVGGSATPTIGGTVDCVAS